MDFTNRAQQLRPGAASNANGAGAAHVELPPKKRGRDQGDDGMGKWTRITTVALAALVALTILALIINFAFGNVNESKYVNKDEYQAVFINVNGSSGGQVYFGRIQSMNDQFIDMTNVFYIQNQNSSSNSSSAYTLIKLGCELHAPQDEMVINQNQVYFWENLKSSGQVAQKIAEYYRQNPNGQNCSQSSASNSTNQSSTNTQQSTSTSNSSNSSSGSSNSKQ